MPGILVVRCGAIIGPKGATIQELRNGSGCDILVEKESQEGQRRVTITGPDQWTVEHGYGMVRHLAESCICLRCRLLEVQVFRCYSVRDRERG